ncbi:MAG: WG repeat-containing protein [Pyrinomonadaceae bacterium]
MKKVLCTLFLTLILLPPVSAQLFSGDNVRLFPFVENGNWGFIDRDGNVVITPAYSSVAAFSEGYAAVELKDGRMTLIDSKGRPQFEPMAARIFPLSENLARYSVEEKWGYLNPDGTIAIAPVYETASDFHSGVARVQKDRRFAFIDEKGVLLTKFYKHAYNFSEGLAIVEIDGKRGYIDVFDDLIIEPIFDDSDGFSQGLAAVRVGSKYGFIDKSGKFAIKADYDNARWFSDGLAPVAVDGLWGFVDQSGDMKIKPAFIRVGNFYEGLAAAFSNGAWGYIDKKGEFQIPPKFNDSGNFSLGVAAVENCEVAASGAKVCGLAYINQKGEIIWDSLGDSSKDKKAVAKAQ